LAAQRPYDEVVVDTAPTGHTLRLLAMPGTLARFARVLGDLQQKHRWMSQSLSGRYVPDASDATIEDVDRQAEELRRLLRDGARCSFHWVLLAEELSLDAARDGGAGVGQLGAAVPEMVGNRVPPAH